MEYAKDLRQEDRSRELLKWLNVKLDVHGLSAQDFDTSFKDPKIVCGLVKCFADKEIDLSRIGEGKEVEEVSRAMSVGERKCKVAPTMVAFDCSRLLCLFVRECIMSSGFVRK